MCCWIYSTGLNTINSVVTTAAEMDRSKCVPRMACEFMAQRGLFNSTSLLGKLSPASSSLDLSKPSTFRSVLG